MLKYGINETTDPGEVDKKCYTYMLLHYTAVHKYFGNLNDLWKAGYYLRAGFDFAGYAHPALAIPT